MQSEIISPQELLSLCRQMLEQERDAEAFALCEKSARLGYAPAQYQLGMMYANGRGTVCSHEMAVHWLLEAAGQGDMEAIRALSSLGAQLD